MKYRGFLNPARVRTNLSLELFSKTPAVLLAFLILVGILIPQNRAYAFGEGAPTIPNANVFGFESSALKVDGPTGALNERIPIVIPPGRNGLQPDIFLDYSSQRTEDGMVGYGWGLSIPYIQRLNKTGSQDLYSTDAVFTSSMDGELVQVSTTTAVTHRARVDTGASNAYSFSGNTWTVYDKKGTRYTFGMDDASRQYDTATTSAKTYTWMLTEIRDTNDNTVVFHYTRDGNQLYPSQINYSGSASTEGPLAVTFTTSARADVRENYKAGFKVTTSYRISEIDTLIASSTAGKYLLSYGTGNNGTRSLLTSVQQQGYDEDSTLVSLPATTFTYASSSTMFYAPSSGGDISLTTSAYVAGDTNGNGKNDINYFYDNNNGQGIKSTMYVDQATNVTNVTPPDYWGYYGTPQERGIRYVDINGDGKPDVVRGFQDDHAATTTTALYVNNYATSTNTYGWTASTTYSGTIPDFGYESYNGLYVMTTGLFGEVNGDGLPDYVMALPGYTGTETDLGNGSAWTATTTIFTPPYNMPSTAPTETASQLVDINGDGLDDWVYSSGSNTYTRLNNGTGWDASASSQWTIATSTLYQTSIGGGGTVYLDRGIRFMDINGDGLPDFVRSYYTPTNANPSATTPMPELGETKVVLLNTGNGWATSTAYTLPYILEGSLDCNCSPNFTGVYAHKEYANWTGNGQMKQDVLTNITSPKGAQKTISYTPSAQLSTNKELPVSLLVVSTTAENDGFGNIATTSYEYSGGKIYLANGIRDRKFAGFAVSTSTAPDSVAVTYYSQGVGLNISLGEQANGFAQINRPFRKDIFDTSGVIKKRTYTRWDTNTLSGSIFLSLGRELTFDYSTTTTHRDRGTDYLYASTTNDLIRTTEYGEVTGSSDGTFSDLGADKRSTVFTYVASTSVNISLPRSKTLFDYSNSTTTDERYYYDTLSFGSVTKGNKTTSEKLKSGATYVSTQNAYNSYGLPTSSTDPRGKVTTYSYDAKNLYVATSTNPLSQTTQFYYDYSLGKPKQTIDPNGRVFETTYDGVDRPLAEKQPDIASPTSLVNKKTYAYTDTIGIRKIVETNYLDGSTDFTLYTYLDGLDRPLQTRKEAETSDQFSVKDFVYNNTGVLQKESLPYFSGGSSKTSASANDLLYSRYTYDALKRPLTIANAVGTTTNTYGAWIATTTDALGNARGLAYDAFGRLVQVTLPDTGNVTAYAYDTVGNLSSITDATANIRNFTYDALGQRLTAEDLHAVGDGTFGTWNYTYDDAGNLTTTLDPKSQTINYTYDDLNRALTENYTGQGGTEVSYAYDSCTEGVGRLCIATSTDAISSITYNALGSTASESKNIASAAYLTSYSYDRQGNITGIVYPDNSEAQYSYNTAGLLESVAQKESGGSFLNLISDFDYAPTEKATFKAFANGVQTTYTFDAEELYRLRSIQTGVPNAGGGGGFSFGSNSWNNVARVSGEFPLAMLLGFDVPEELSIIEKTAEEVPDLHSAESIASTTDSTSKEETSLDESESVNTLPSVLVEIATSTESIISETELQSDQATTAEQTAIEKATDAVDTPEQVRVQLPIWKIIANNSASEKATIKGKEIAKIAYIPRVERSKYAIEIVSMEPIEGGVQVFVKAWDQNGSQIGFGKGGFVEMERFRIFNPPILVPDENGEIIHEAEVENDNGEKETVQQRFREDPHEALLQVIEHNLSVMKNIHSGEKIVKGKRGNTTSTFFPAAGTNTPVDGYARRSPGETGWSDVRNGAGTLSDSTGTIGQPIAGYGTTVGGTPTSMVRSIFGFDTSSIPETDLISSAVLSVWAYSPAGSGVTLVVDRNVPGSTSAIANGDYDVGGWGGSDLSDRVDWGSSQYKTYTLNSTGRGFVNSAGYSWLGLRHVKDVDDSYTSGSTSFANGSFADASGTSEDPKLVVEHSLPNDPPTPPTTLWVDGQTNPSIATSAPGFSAIYNDPESADIATNYRIQVATSTVFTSPYWDSTKNALASSSPQGTRIANISYGGSALASSTTYYWRIKFWDYLDAEGDWSTATSTFLLFGTSTPEIPANLLSEGATNPSDIDDSTPEFSAVFNDSDNEGLALSYEIEVSVSSAFTSTVWDTGKMTLASSTPPSMRIADIEYAGSSLTPSVTYYWRIKFWDNTDQESPWSTATSTFSLSAAAQPPPSYGGRQNLTYTYDAVGNITEISDTSGSGTGRTVIFGYDNLYRLTTASTTVASSTPYSHTYTYNSLGNITSMTGLGSYTYAGTGYANPHAPTSVNGVMYSYDNNGNLTNYASTTSGWDYRNRLITSAASSSPNTSFGYDHTANRMFKSTNFATTTTPNKYYTVTSATTTKNIFTPSGELIASIIGTGANATTTYVHTDHLGGTNVVTDENSDTVEIEDSYPYGVSRISTTYGVSKNQRQFAGTERDTEVNLDYMINRYYSADRGQFISQDPVFWEVGMTGDGRMALQNPQSQNSYGYAGGNPITQKDPSGRQYVDYNASFAVPVYGVPIGPTGGFYSAPGSNSGPIVYFGIGASNRPGPSGSVVYSPMGSPQEGWNASVSGFTNKGVGGQFGISQNGVMTPSTGVGVGIPGISGSLTYSIDLYKLLSVAGSVEYVTTPMTSSSVMVGSQNSVPQASLSFRNMTSQIGASRSTTSSQGAALTRVTSAFSPQNARQAAAVQNVVSAFTKNN